MEGSHLGTWEVPMINRPNLMQSRRDVRERHIWVLHTNLIINFLGREKQKNYTFVSVAEECLERRRRFCFALTTCSRRRTGCKNFRIPRVCMNAMFRWRWEYITLRWKWKYWWISQRKDKGINKHFEGPIVPKDIAWLLICAIMDGLLKTMQVNASKRCHSSWWKCPDIYLFRNPDMEGLMRKHSWDNIGLRQTAVL